MKKLIENKIKDGVRITDEETRFLFDQELGYLGRIATFAKKRIHPGNHATFIVDININVTNICSVRCDFCAFHVEGSSDRAFVLSVDDVLEKVGKLVEIGGTQVMLQGGINEDLGLAYYSDLFQSIKDKYDVYIHALSPAEIWALSEKESFSIEEILNKLRNAGLDSLPGGGAEILADRVRNEISPKKVSSDKWLEIMRIAHSIGMNSTATMMFGITETIEERVEHLGKIRDLQDETGGFRAFIPWSFSPTNTKFSDIIPTGGGEYLKTLAVSRIYLDNINHIGSGWLTEGMQVAQLGLAFGADDMGGVLLEEKVLKAAGVNNTTGVDEMVRVIADAGYTPAQRNTQYEIIQEFKSQ